MLNYAQRILISFYVLILYLAITVSYNIFFVLSGGGTLNYFGAKGFIEQELEGLYAEYLCSCVVFFINAVDSSSLLHNADYTICLSAVGVGDQLYVHTSKPPKPGSAPYRILQVSCRMCWILVHLPLETFLSME